MKLFTINSIVRSRTAETPFVEPGVVFDFDEAEGLSLLDMKAARQPTEDELERYDRLDAPMRAKEQEAAAKAAEAEAVAEAKAQAEAAEAERIKEAAAVAKAAEDAAAAAARAEEEEARAAVAKRADLEARAEAAKVEFRSTISDEKLQERVEEAEAKISAAAGDKDIKTPLV